MDIGLQIKTFRRAKNLTQKELAQKSGAAENTIRQYELGLRKPSFDQLVNIAAALGVTINDLVGTQKDHFYWLNLKLRAIGYSYDFEEDDAFLWLVYPDGTLEVTDQILIELNEECDEYLRFKLEELKRKNASDFKAKK